MSRNAWRLAVSSPQRADRGHLVWFGGRLPVCSSRRVNPEAAGVRYRRTSAAGFTLIELTVVLAVIVTLALILTPSVTNFINDSRVARARTDTQTIAAAVVQFY